MNIVRAELRRILARRASKVAAMIATLVVVLTGVMTFVNHADAAPDLAAAEREAAASTASCMEYALSDPNDGIDQSNVDAHCYSDPAWYVQDQKFHITSVLRDSNGDTPWKAVRAESMARTEIYEYNNGNPNDAALSEKEGPAFGFTGGLVSDAVFLIMIATVLGATYVGADWRTGVIESQLVRVPRRARLIAGKLTAVAVATSLATVGFLVLYLLAVVPSAIWKGDFAHSGPSFWLDVVTLIGASGLVAGLMGTLGASLAMVARNTVAGVAAPLVALVGGGFLINTPGRWTPFITLGDNLNAFIGRGDVAYIFEQKMMDGGTTWDRVVSHGPIVAGLLIAAAAIGAAFLSGSMFQRRDVS